MREDETVSAYPEKCPKCERSLIGEPIPEHRHKAHGATHYSLAIGVYDPKSDRTIGWRCPHCWAEWKRWVEWKR